MGFPSLHTDGGLIPAPVLDVFATARAGACACRAVADICQLIEKAP